MTKFIGRKNNQVSTNAQLGGMAFQDSSNAAVGNIDIESISGSPNIKGFDKHVYETATNVFVYDTSKDSDGGAWRKRTQNTSWYNETLNTATRGSRREFPAVAVLVLTAHKLTIYDGDDPDLPMWMDVYQYVNGGSGGTTTNWHGGSGTFTSVAALNGIIICSTNGTRNLHFINDRMSLFYTPTSGNYTQLGGISNRNDSYTSWGPSDEYYAQLREAASNDVAMTVLPNAPIDDATGLPIPTIAVANNGGVSVIKDDRTVVDLYVSTSSYDNVMKLSFTDDNKISYTVDGTNQSRAFRVDSIPSSDFAVTSNQLSKGNGEEFYVSADYGFSNGDLAFSKKSSEQINDLVKRNAAHTTGLSLIEKEDGGPRHAFVTSSFNTGWMHGDIKGAFLSDTDATNVASSNLMSGATYNISARITSYSYTNGSDTLVINDDEATADGYVMLTLGGLSPSTKYVISYTSDNTYTPTTGYNPHVGNTSVGTSYFDTTQTGSGQGSMTFTTASSGDPTLVMYSNYSGGNLTYTIQLRLAEEDRSVNDNGLQVYGTVTKSAVAAGAELVAYTGFNGSNYLEQPHNSGMEVGTGDFYVMGWFKGLDNTYNAPFEISSPNVDAAGVGSILLLAGSAYPGLRFYTRSTGDWVYNTNGVPFVNDNSTWNFVCCLRRSGVKYIYMNGGAEVNAGTHSADLTETDSIMRLGCRSDTAPGSASPWTGSLSLWRFGQGAPSAKQVKKIYEDEKDLFQENAKATLYGSSDVVTALAYDEVNDLLHVGTSNGRSDFQGLRRINNTTKAVSTAISAHDGFIAQQ